MNIFFAAAIFLAAFIILLLLYVFPMLSMHPLKSGKIEGTDVVAIKNRTNNLFFIPADKDWIVIDAGSDAKLVKREMEKLSIDGCKVKWVFLTHTDYDHVAAITLFPDAIIYMGKQEEQMINGSVNRQFIKKNKLPKLNASNEIRYLSDNEAIDLHKRRIHIKCAPGHTRGSAVYVLDEKYLFAGDAFKIMNGHIALHPYSMDRKTARKTICEIEDELNKGS